MYRKFFIEFEVIPSETFAVRVSFYLWIYVPRKIVSKLIVKDNG